MVGRSMSRRLTLLVLAFVSLAVRLAQLRGLRLEPMKAGEDVLAGKRWAAPVVTAGVGLDSFDEAVLVVGDDIGTAVLARHVH